MDAIGLINRGATKMSKSFWFLSLCACSFFSMISHAQGQFGFPSVDGDYRERDSVQSTNTFGWGGANDLSRSSRYVPPSSVQDWKLGVYVDNTDRGVVITRIQPGSAAQRSGLEVGDTIVNVAGYQVGYVQGRLYDVSDEIRRRIGPSGSVSLLIQERRSSRLANREISLQSSSITISGLLSWQDRAALPPNALLQLRLDNVSRPYQEVRGGSTTTQIVRQQPVPFQMYVDPQYLTQGDRYRFQAAIVSGNQTLYILQNPIDIDPLRGSVTNLNLNLTRIGGSFPGGDYTVGYPPTSNNITDYYQRMLGRTPQQWEVEAWLKHLARGKPLQDLPVSLLSGDEYFDRAGGTDARYVDRLFLTVARRPPTRDEVDRWVPRFQRAGARGRTQVVGQFWAEYGNG